MSELFSIQLQNRQQQGRDGVWLDLPTTTEQVQAALRQIGISSDNPQGLFISGYFAEEEKRFAIPYNMVLASNVDELNFLASRLETLSTGERAELNAALQAPQSELFSIGKITDFPENVEYYVHLPEVRGPAQLGDYYLNRSGMVNMPDEWKGGIDTAQFGRYVAQQEQGAFTQYGYLVKSGDEWQKVHEGQPVPEEYRVLSFPAPEVLRDSANISPPIQSEPQLQKVLPIILNGKDSAERMKEITDRLETGIQQLFDSDRYKCFAAGEPPLSGRTERNILATLDLVALLLQEPQKIVKILGLRDGCIYGGFQLRLPARALAVRVPLGIALATVLTGHYHGQAVFLAKSVTGAPDVSIASPVGNILPLVHHVHSTENDVVVDVSLVNVRGQHIRVFALQDFICKLPANLVGLLRRGFARRKRLYQVVGQIVAFLHGL